MSTRGILALFIVLAILGWVGLASFTYYNPPAAWNRGIAVAILWLTLWATLLPLAYWFHLRRHRLPRTERGMEYRPRTERAPHRTRPAQNAGWSTEDGVPRMEYRAAEEGVVPRAARQSALAALFVTLCLWLRTVQALNWANLILLLALLVLTEVVLSARRLGSGN